MQILFKKNALALLMLAIITSTVSAQQRPDVPFEPGFFPLSVWYIGAKARAPMLSKITPESPAEWRRDLQQIRDLGFNTVRTWVEWQRAEPGPGEYNFQNLQLLLELAEEAGLKVIVQMYADSAPEWVGKQFPTAKFQTQSGVKIESQAAPGFCTDHPGVGEAMYNFYTQTAGVAAGYSA
ncbi:MAG: beta-galactosidase, partial [Balneolaceae bacterium]